MINLNYESNSDKLNIFVNDKKITIQEFICYMQYEYFILFLINVLNDLKNVNDFAFPDFSKKDLHLPFVMEIHESRRVAQKLNFCDFKILKTKKYISILNNKDKYIFACNNKAIRSLQDFFQNDNRYHLIKILKTIFETIFLYLHSQDKCIRLEYRPDINIFYLEAS